MSILSCANPECPDCLAHDASCKEKKLTYGCYWPRKCWWVENGRCFCPAMGPVPRRTCNGGLGSILGHTITEEHLSLCRSRQTARPGLRRGDMTKVAPLPKPYRAEPLDTEGESLFD